MRGGGESKGHEKKEGKKHRKSSTGSASLMIDKSVRITLGVTMGIVRARHDQDQDQDQEHGASSSDRGSTRIRADKALDRRKLP